MFNYIRDIAKAVKEVRDEKRRGIELLKIEYRKMQDQLAFQQALDERARRGFTYGDMQDLVKVASRVQVLVKFADGTTINLRSTDPLEDYNQAMRKQGEFF